MFLVVYVFFGIGSRGFRFLGKGLGGCGCLGYRVYVFSVLGYRFEIVGVGFSRDEG